MNMDAQDTNQNGNDMLKIPGIWGWLLNQSPSLILLCLAIVWQTNKQTALEAKIDFCNEARMKTYEEQTKLMIETLYKTNTVIELNSKALDKNSEAFAKRR